MVDFVGCVSGGEASGPPGHCLFNEEDYMTIQHHQVITKVLVSAAIALGSCVGGAASARADANPAGTDPNPFGALSCNCPQPAPPGSPAPMGQIEQGILAGLAASPANRSIS